MESRTGEASIGSRTKKRLDGDPIGDEDEEDTSQELTVYEAIRLSIRDHLRNDNTEGSWITSLQYWWSRTFNLPLKHPILQEYTLEELAWEYFNRTEREIYEKEKAEEEADKIEIAKEEEAEAWADQMMAEEANTSKNPLPGQEPSSENDQEWMKRLIEEEKQTHGETFGEDIVEEF